MSARRLSLVAVAVALVATLAACGDDSEDRPSTLPTASEAPSSAMASATPDSTDGSLESDKQESAERFARTWHEVFNAAQASGDFAQLEQITAPSCALCLEEIGNVKQYLEQGQEIRGGEFEVISAVTTAYSPPSALVEVTSLTSAAEVVDSSGNVVNSFESTAPGSVIMNLLENGSSWVVQDMIRN